jgi:hypothetical protein
MGDRNFEDETRIKHSITFDRIRTKLSIPFTEGSYRVKQKCNSSLNSKVRALLFLLTVFVGASFQPFRTRSPTGIERRGNHGRQVCALFMLVTLLLL